ncbi:MAG: hypothetical protein JRI25_06185 [Deltaproteobacteria bacterium]|nr:hypothetical protein [Deltaproteobacteria bacterium]
MERGGSEGRHARCLRCGHLFAAEEDHWVPLTSGHKADHALAAQLGFAVRETDLERERRLDPGVATHYDVDGIPLKVDDHGVHVDKERLRGRITHRVEQKINQYIFGCVFTVIFTSCMGLGFLGAGVYIVAVVGKAFSERGTPAEAGGTQAGVPTDWDGEAPFVCKGNDVVTLDHPDAHFEDGVAVTAEGNCALTLIEPNLSAPTALLARGNAEVSVLGGTLRGTDAAIRAEGLAKITGSGVSVEGEKVAAKLAAIEIE